MALRRYRFNKNALSFEVINGDPNANGLMLTVVGSNGSSTVINRATTRDARASLGGLFQYQGTDEQLMNLARAGTALGLGLHRLLRCDAYATYTANPWYLNLSAGAVQHQYRERR